MRTLLFVLLACCAGCGQSAAQQTSPAQAAQEQPAAAALAPADEPVADAPASSDLPELAGPHDWPIFLGPTGDSKSREQGVLLKWPAAGPKILWQRELGEGYGIGSISRGRMYQADREGDKARLVCLNAETGEQMWLKEYPTEYVDMYGYDGGPRCSPLVDGERVYTYGVEGMLHCYQAENGEVLWSVDTAKEFNVIQNFFGVGSNPVIEGDLLIVMVGGSPEDGPRSVESALPNGTAIVAFNKFTGKVVYKLGDDLASYASLKLATIGDRRWCFAFCREGLLAFEPTQGKVDFHYPWRAKMIESVNASVPVVKGEHVLISETYGPGSSLLQVIPGDYRVVWQDDAKKRAKALQTHWNTPVEVNGYVYGSSGRHTENAELRCIELKTGKVMWSEPGLTRCSLLYVDGHFISQGEYGQLLVFKANPAKYEVVSDVLLADPAGAAGPRFPGAEPPALLKYPAWAAPVIAQGRLYVRGKDRLVCLDVRK